MSVLIDRVKIFAASSGPGPFTLGPAVESFRGSEALDDGQEYSYAVGQGAEFEYGTGEYLLATNSLIRVPINSSRGGAPVPFSAGVEISFTALARDYGTQSADSLREDLAGNGGADLVGMADGRTVQESFGDKQNLLTPGTGIAIDVTDPLAPVISALAGGSVTNVTAGAVGTSGTNITLAVADGTTTPTITLNVPTVSASARGAVTSAQFNTWQAKQDALVSGTSIKTVAGSSLLGSGNVGTTVGGNLLTLPNPGAITFPRFNADNTVSALDATAFRTAIGAGSGGGSVTNVTAAAVGTTGTDVGLSVADGTTTPTITLTIPTTSASNRGLVTSAQFNTWQAKQDALVSGTSIKTVNSTSLLGSGNVAVQAPLVSGTNIKTVNSTSLLGSGDVAVQAPLVSGTNIKTVAGSSLLGSGNVGTTVGGNLLTLPNPGAITFPRFNADNTVSALDATAFRTAIGIGAGLNSSDVTFQQAWGTARNYDLRTKGRQTFDLSDFGAPTGDDWTVPLLAAAAAMTAGDVRHLILPEGTLNFTSPLVFKGNDRSIRGKGRGATTLNYTGANTTNDLIVIGDLTDTLVQTERFDLHDFKVDSSTTMTGGRAIRLHRWVFSTMSGVSLGHQDVSPKLYHGFHFEGFGDSYVLNFNARVQGKGAMVQGLVFAPEPINGAWGAGLFFVNGKLVLCGQNGMHIGGGAGGVVLTAVDIIANSSTGLLIDNALVSLQNREVFTTQGTSIDGNGLYGIHINDTLVGHGWLGFNSVWSCANLSHNIYVQNWGSYGRISLVGATLQISLGGDGLNVADNSCYINARQASIYGNAGFAINDTGDGYNIDYDNIGGSFGNTLGFYRAGSVTVDVPITRVRRYTGTLNGSGAANVAHNYALATTKVISVSAYYVATGGEAVPIPNPTVDGTSIILAAGAPGASRPYRVVAEFEKSGISG